MRQHMLYSRYCINIFSVNKKIRSDNKGYEYEINNKQQVNSIIDNNCFDSHLLLQYEL